MEIAPRTSQQGAVLVELALVFPILLFLVYAIVFISFCLNARASIETAVDVGVRLGMTRGDTSRVGTQNFIPAINNWATTSEPYTLADLYTTSGQSINTYNTWANASFSQATSLQQLPTQYRYALYYTLASIRDSLGESVKFPCDPDTTDGCLKCIFLNPMNFFTPATVPDPTTQYTAALGTLWSTYPAVGIQCTYQPPLALFQPVRGIYRVLTRGGTLGVLKITRRAFGSPGQPSFIIG